MKHSHTVLHRAALAAAWVAVAPLGTLSHAATLDSGIEGLKATWDNTLKYSTAYRLKSPSPAVTSDANLDDGDRNFGKGFISQRVDLLSEFDLQYQEVGLRLSGAAWYDQAYNQRNDNPGMPSAFPNQASGAYNEFPAATRNLHGRKAELLDAFVFGRLRLGEVAGMVRVGRHGLTWGESLFFGANGIAGGMAPVDAIKLIAVPGTQFKEAIRPVPQISGQVQLTSTLTLGAYYQLRWERSRLPGVGSYFSQSDTAVEGGQQILLPPPDSAPRLADQTPRDAGQGGAQLRWRAANSDFGLYAIRFHEKSHQITPRIGASPFPVGYNLVYHQGITAYGASASHSFGNANVAMEVSTRRRMDLASTSGVDLSALGWPATNNTDNPSYAVGNTAHANLSVLWFPDPNPVFNESSLIGEVIWNRVLSCRVNCAALDPNATRDAYALRMIFEPTFRQVVPGLDLGVPVGLGYAPRGSRSMALGAGGLPPENGGDLSVGLNASYLDAWRFTLAYTRFFGSAKPFLTPTVHYSYGQSLQDRDFIALSLRRTF